MAVRLKYAGIDPELLVVDPSIERSLDDAVAHTDRTTDTDGTDGVLFALPTYTALIELRKLLTDRGLAKEFWR
jgi:hypothetical protein